MTATTVKLEARLFKNYWDDGLVDLLAGTGLLLIGLGWRFDQPVMAAVAPALLVPLWIPLRRRLVEPRSGYVEFSSERQARTRHGNWLAILLGVVTFVLGVVVYSLVRSGEVDQRVSTMIPALPGVLVAGLGVVAAQMLAAKRFVGYALVLLAGSAATIVQGWGPAAPMLIGSAVVLGTGVWLLSRFLRGSAAFEAER